MFGVLPEKELLEQKEERCTGCSMCVNVCPHEVFVINNKKARIVDKDRCMECGACAKNCASSAIEVKPGVGCVYAIMVGKLTACYN